MSQPLNIMPGELLPNVSTFQSTLKDQLTSPKFLKTLLEFQKKKNSCNYKDLVKKLYKIKKIVEKKTKFYDVKLVLGSSSGGVIATDSSTFDEYSRASVEVPTASFASLQGASEASLGMWGGATSTSPTIGINGDGSFSLSSGLKSSDASFSFTA